MSDQLIIFTRYPEPGQAKTRLIPALGNVAAADLHRRMTEHTLAQIRPLPSGLTLEVQFTGADLHQMQAWLGADLRYRRQGEGNLGDRLAQAFQSALAQPVEGVIIIGSDCPDLTSSHVLAALQALGQSDLVLGPSQDGGYYLMGLRRFVPDLFQTIAWSSDRVFAQTVAIAHRLNLSITVLPILADVDRPEDLPVWERVCNGDPLSQPHPHALSPTIAEIEVSNS